jgi:hypothetical protein
MKYYHIFTGFNKINIRVLLILMLLIFAATNNSWGIGSNDTTWTRFKHIKTAVITYSTSAPSLSGFVARKFDLAINPSGTFLSNLQDSVAAYGSTMKYTSYFGISNFSSEDYTDMHTFCAEKDYEYDSMFLWMETDSFVVDCSYAGDCDGDIVNKPPDSVAFHVWSSYRSVPEQRRQEVWDWYIWKYFNARDTSVFYGIMEDEATIFYHPTYENHSNGFNSFPFNSNAIVAGEPNNVMGWDGMTHQEITDSLIVLKQTGWLKNLIDTLYACDKIRLSNGAAYGVTGSDVIDDIFITGTGVLYGENMWIRALGTSYKSDAWALMDAMAAADTGYAVIWTSITPSQDTLPLAEMGGLGRAQLEMLAWYYMAADYEHCSYMVSNQSSHPNDFKYASDSVEYWTNAIEYDVGQPDSMRYIDTSGTDGAGQSFSLYRRDYTRADGRDVIMLYRGKNGSNYSSSSAVPIALGGTYQSLLADGTLDVATDSAEARNAEGLIFISTTTLTTLRYLKNILRGQ